MKGWVPAAGGGACNAPLPCFLKRFGINASGRSSNRTCVTFDVTNCFSPLTLKCHCFNARRLEKYPDIVAGNLTTEGSRAGLLQSCVCVTIAGQQSIDISWPPGAQQQTRRTLLQRSIDGTDRRTDTGPLHQILFRILCMQCD